MYKLDQLLQEESGTLQSLQRDKEDLEKALGGLKKQLQNNHGVNTAFEAAKKQQHSLEKELSRVHQLLAENSKVVQVPSTQIVIHYALFYLHSVQQKCVVRTGVLSEY